GFIYCRRLLMFVDSSSSNRYFGSEAFKTDKEFRRLVSWFIFCEHKQMLIELDKSNVAWKKKSEVNKTLFEAYPELRTTILSGKRQEKSRQEEFERLVKDFEELM